MWLSVARFILPFLLIFCAVRFFLPFFLPSHILYGPTLPICQWPNVGCCLLYIYGGSCSGVGKKMTNQEVNVADKMGGFSSLQFHQQTKNKSKTDSTIFYGCMSLSPSMSLSINSLNFLIPWLLPKLLNSVSHPLPHIQKPDQSAPPSHSTLMQWPQKENCFFYHFN